MTSTETQTILKHFDARFDALNAKIDEVDERLCKKIDEVDERLCKKIDQVDERLSARIDISDDRSLKQGILLEDMVSKIQLLAEGQEMLGQKIDRKIDELRDELKPLIQVNASAIRHLDSKLDKVIQDHGADIHLIKQQIRLLH